MLWGENRGKWKGRQPLAWAASALPLSHNNRTITSPHNLPYVLHRWYWIPQSHTWQPFKMCSQNSVRVNRKILSDLFPASVKQDALSRHHIIPKTKFNFETYYFNYFTMISLLLEWPSDFQGVIFNSNFRDNVTSKDPDVEYRRKEFEDIFTKLETVGKQYSGTEMTPC